MNKKVLILCTGNSCRSQMAEGWIRHFAPDNTKVYSAGIETHGVNPKAIETMEEAGINISTHTSNNLNEYTDIEFDYIITVCDNAKENCPYFPGSGTRLHHNFPDPAKAVGTAEEVLNSFAEVRDMIRDYSQEFATNELWD